MRTAYRHANGPQIREQPTDMRTAETREQPRHVSTVYIPLTTRFEMQALLKLE